MIEIIQTQSIDSVWPMISDKIAKCLDDRRADCTTGDLWRMCRAGEAFLIVSHHEGDIQAATIWRFETWLHGPVLKNLITVNVNGRMKDWLPYMVEAVTMFAKAGGADRFIWQGREAWGRIFRDAKPLATIYEMRV